MRPNRHTLAWAAAALACAWSLPRQARATEQGDLIACFRAVRYYSEGPGDELTVFDTQGRTTLAVPDRPGGEEGFFIYGDEDTAFQAIPTEDRSTTYHSSYLQFPLPGRPKEDIFYCNYTSVETDPAYKTGLKCTLYPSDGVKYRSVKPHPVAARQRLWPLKSAVLIRLSTVSQLFRKRVDTYSKAVEDYKQSQANPSGWDQARALLGWRDSPPVPPNDDPVYKAVNLCGQTEDSEVHEAALMELKSLNHIAIPPMP